MANNVIQFPLKNIVNKNKQPTIEEVDSSIALAKHYHVQETIANIAPMIFNHLDISGFPLFDEEEEEGLKDGALIIESIRSMLLKYYGMHHPFQILAENVFICDDEDETSMKIVDEISVSLKNESDGG